MSTARFRKGKLMSLPVIMVAIVAFSILTPERVDAASVECFIKFPPPTEGESTDRNHQGWIFVGTWGFGVSEPTATPASGAVRTVRSQLQDFRFAARMGKHSPLLFTGSLSKVVYKEVILACQRPGTVPFEFLRITLNDVVVKGYQSETPTTVGSPPMPMADTYPIDQVSLVFGKIRIVYSPQLPDGHSGPRVEAGWDEKLNKLQ